ncbi:MAG: ubiquinol-cytochrome c reductase iron-sulfur subunit [Deltaproteobacteria bacterium]|nr:ubiquinol-cytochrome c reductase iron-sulfur subunit [Deltaproteobacteria bacterium]
MSSEPHHQASLPRSRRRFTMVLLGAISGAIGGILGIPLGGFFGLPALRSREFAWAEAGPVDGFKVGEIRFVALMPLRRPVWPEEAPRMGAFVSRKADGTFEVFHNHCTHVGCPVNWNPAAQRFFSPCHGGVFDRSGRVLAGPPQRPLDRHEMKVEKGVLYAGEIYSVNERLERVGRYHS